MIWFTFMEHDEGTSRMVSRCGVMFQDMRIWACGDIGSYVEIFFGFVIDASEIEQKPSQKLYDTHV